VEVIQHRDEEASAGGVAGRIVVPAGRDREDVSAVQVTFDSDEPIENVIKVLEAVYGVQISVSHPTGKSRHD
jgi:Tfp pilus assembly protein PilZ